MSGRRNGKDFNLFKLVIVTVTAFNTESDVKMTIRGQRHLSLVNYGSATVEYSFDGENVAGDLRNGTSTAALTFQNRSVSEIWFRLTSPGSVEVRVEAWA